MHKRFLFKYPSTEVAENLDGLLSSSFFMS